MWLKFVVPNSKPMFAANCYIPHRDSNFYNCLDKDQPFVELEEGIVHFKDKGEVIVFGDMNAHTQRLQHDTQQCDTPQGIRRQDDVHMYERRSKDEK